MKLIRKEKSRQEKVFEFFIKKLEAKGFDLKVYDKKKIVKNYGQGLFDLLFNALFEIRPEVNTNKFSFIFDEKDPRISWLSEIYEDRIVVNLARSSGTVEFKQAIKEANRFFELMREEINFH